MVLSRNEFYSKSAIDPEYHRTKHLSQLRAGSAEAGRFSKCAIRAGSGIRCGMNVCQILGHKETGGLKNNQQQSGNTCVASMWSFLARK